MRKIINVVIITLFVSLNVIGQEETPKAEVFGGYSYAGSGSNGWNASVAGNFNKWLSAVADFNGQYTDTSETGISEKIKSYSYLFGPQLSIRKNKRVTPFVRALFGGAHIKTKAVESGQTFEFSDSSFSMAFGGGLDVRVSKNVAIRAFQIDYVRTKFFGETQNKGRLAFGIVFRLGTK